MTPADLRALVVEDDTSWQQILTEILADLGLVVDVAGDLEQAMGLLKSESHRLAIVDLSLDEANHSNTDGLRILDAARRLDPGCRTVLLTGFATVELAVSAITEYGALTFLRKENFKRGEFRQLIGRLLSSIPAPEPEASRPGPADILIPSGFPEMDAQVKSALIVEDDAGWRSILSEILVDDGFEVRQCASFGDAFGVLRRQKFSLAVIDLSLSDTLALEPSVSTENLEGYRLLAETGSSGIPTIVVSGIASTEEIQHTYSEHSIFAFLEKQAFDRSTFRRLAGEALLANSAGAELACLTFREHEVFGLMAKGMTNKEIAETLVITNNTVKRHLKAIFEKLEVHTRSAALAKGLNTGEG